MQGCCLFLHYGAVWSVKQKKAHCKKSSCSQIKIVGAKPKSSSVSASSLLLAFAVVAHPVAVAVGMKSWKHSTLLLAPPAQSMPEKACKEAGEEKHCMQASNAQKSRLPFTVSTIWCAGALRLALATAACSAKATLLHPECTATLLLHLEEKLHAHLHAKCLFKVNVIQ